MHAERHFKRKRRNKILQNPGQYDSEVPPLTHRTHQMQGHLILVAIPVTEGSGHLGLPHHSSESHDCCAVQTRPGELPGYPWNVLRATQNLA